MIKTNPNRATREGGKSKAATQSGTSASKPSGEIQPQSATVREYKIVSLRECSMEYRELLDADDVEKFWRRNIATAPQFDPDRENLVVITLDTRRRATGFQIISQGTLDTLLVRVPEVFRLAVASNASTVIVAHNHPSGDPQPSGADIAVTRELKGAAALIKIDLRDHVIIGGQHHFPTHTSFSENWGLKEPAENPIPKPPMRHRVFSDDYLEEMAGHLNAKDRRKLGLKFRQWARAVLDSVKRDKPNAPAILKAAA